MIWEPFWRWMNTPTAKKQSMSFRRCMCFLALDLVSPDSFRRCMCLLALDVDSLALDLSVFFLALGPMLISGVGGTQGIMRMEYVLQYVLRV